MKVAGALLLFFIMSAGAGAQLYFSSWSDSGSAATMPWNDANLYILDEQAKQLFGGVLFQNLMSFFYCVFGGAKAVTQ